MDMHGVRIAAVAGDGVEESELTEPMRAFRDAGARVDVLAAGESKSRRKIRAFQHLDPSTEIPADGTIDDANPDDYDAVLIPGGRSPDMIRTDDAVLRFVRAMDAARKPMLVICHGPQVLISAGLVEGRRLASWPSVAVDVENAGGTCVDQEAVRDENLVTSRKPADIPAFIRESARAVLESRHARTAVAPEHAPA